MQNKTQSILLELLPRLRKDYIDNRPEVILYRRDFEEQYKAFCQAHRHNPTLLRAVDDLLDHRLGWKEVDREYEFLLGLRMGLDLSGLDILSDF